MADGALGVPEVLSAAEAAGFGAAAVLPLDAVAEASILPWLAAGHQGEMAYLERHARLRTAPRAAFPGFESVLVAIADYGDAGGGPPDLPLGRISRYALSDDYHDLVKERLRRVGAALSRNRPRLRTRPLVDANPLNEKVLARLAGLGFVGKHSNLILERRGSWFFLGVLLLSERVDGRGPIARNRCGTCERCITACPTRAIVEPYVVDARLCISYLTIELKGPIPRDLRPAIGNRIFGCDDCQEACPWNRFAHRGAREPFRPRDGLQGRPLEDWLRLQAAGFDEVFRGSAVLRAGYEGFLRNVLVAAGNSRDSTLIPAVRERLDDPSALIRGHAAWALGRIGGVCARDALRGRLPREPDPGVREEIGIALDEPASPNGPMSGLSEFGKRASSHLK
jgi:epoxyqueuosine reductase